MKKEKPKKEKPATKTSFKVINIRADGSIIEDMSSVVIPATHPIYNMLKV
jgi:hypothetical protein